MSELPPDDGHHEDVPHQGAPGEFKARAREAGDSKTLEIAARCGFCASALIHLLLGVFAIRMALGAHVSNPSQSGAVHAVAVEPGGRMVLWVVAGAFAALALWRFAHAAYGPIRLRYWHQLIDRGKAIGQGIIYLVLGGTSFIFALGGHTNSARTTQDVTAALMSTPAGSAVVFVAGGVIIGIGISQVLRGARRKHRNELRGTREAAGKVVFRLGTVGYIAKGLAVIVVGALFMLAVITADPDKAAGLDAALHALAGEPGGRVALMGIGIGLLCYGLYLIGRTRYARMHRDISP